MPARILDTRATQNPVRPGSILRLKVAGAGGVPADGAQAVVMNVTATNATATSYLTVYPDGVAQPTASNLNFVAGQTVPNLVEVKLGADGTVDFYNAAGTVDVIADVAGWVTAAGKPSTPEGLFNPMPPSRVLDTRNGVGASQQPLGAGQTITVSVTDFGARAGAAVLNLTATNASAASYLTVWPHGSARPVVSNLNVGAGQTVANRVQVAVDSTGKVDIYNAAGSVDVVADLNGWFTGASSAAAQYVYSGQAPTRILDTRDGGGSLGPGAVHPVQVAGVGGVPVDAKAVVANLTVTNTTAPSYVTAYPHGVTRPTASDLNWVAGQTVPNLTIVKLGAGGAIDLYNAAGDTDAIIDIVGWYR
jgi:hypothetical protein